MEGNGGGGGEDEPDFVPFHERCLNVSDKRRRLLCDVVAVAENDPLLLLLLLLSLSLSLLLLLLLSFSLLLLLLLGTLQVVGCQ